MSKIAPDTIVSAGIDWLTVTMRPDFPQLRELEGLVMAEHAQAKERGETVKMTSPQGYVGAASDHIFFGAREDGYMMRLSSDAADKLHKELLCCEPEYKVTRIDLQVSAKRRPEDVNFAPRMRAAVRAFEAEAGRKRQIKLSTVEDAAGGNSLTLFSRSSECFFRVYDKSAEQRHKIEANIVRFEGEFKGDTARAVWGMVKKTKDTKKLAKSLLATRLQKVGISEPWMHKQRVIEIPTVYVATDDERRLEYLSNHVKGIIDRLRDAGLEDEAKAALGFK